MIDLFIFTTVITIDSYFSTELMFKVFSYVVSDLSSEMLDCIFMCISVYHSSSMYIDLF